MGIVDLDNNNMPEDWVLSLDANNVHLILSEQEIVASELFAGGEGNESMTLDTLPADSAVPAGMLDTSKIVVIEVQADEEKSIERISGIRRQYPDLPLVAAIRDAKVATVRMLLKNGISDVVELPVSQTELSDVLQQLRAGMHDVTVETKPAKIVSVIKSIGGVGATTLATHLASRQAEIDSEYGKSTCLFDLDLQFGNAGSYLSVGQSLSLADLLNAGSRIDGDLVRSVAHQMPTSLNVIQAPSEIMPMESVKPDQMYRIVDIASQEFDTLFFDMPGNWTNWSLSLVARSDLVLLVVELTIASLRQAKRQLKLLADQGISGDHVQVVVNRVEKRLFRSINLADAERAINYPVAFKMHNDYQLVSAAHDQGVLIEDIRAKSKISQDIDEILASFDPETDEDD